MNPFFIYLRNFMGYMATIKLWKKYENDIDKWRLEWCILWTELVITSWVKTNKNYKNTAPTSAIQYRTVKLTLPAIIFSCKFQAAGIKYLPTDCKISSAIRGCSFLKLRRSCPQSLKPSSSYTRLWLNKCHPKIESHLKRWHVFKQ